MDKNINNPGNQESMINEENKSNQEEQDEYVEFEGKGKKVKFAGKGPARIVAVGAVVCGVVLVGTVAVTATLVITRSPEAAKEVAQNVIKFGTKAVA
jgi:hypothetical protein